jgi:hypothetical protein
MKGENNKLDLESQAGIFGKLKKHLNSQENELKALLLGKKLFIYM